MSLDFKYMILDKIIFLSDQLSYGSDYYYNQVWGANNL